MHLILDFAFWLLKKKEVDYFSIAVDRAAMEPNPEVYTALIKVCRNK